MAEAPSSNQTIAEAGEGAVAGPINGVLPSLEVVLTADGVPVVDLREALAQDGALVVVDGELMLRLADGTEWPVDVTVAEGDVVLQVAEQGYIAASSAKAALQTPGTVLPLASLVAAAGDASETVAEAAAAAEPGAEGEAPAHGGGAAFRVFEIGSLGQGLDPLLALGPTSLGAGIAANALFDPRLDDQDGLGDSSFGGGSRYVNFAPIAKDDLATTSEREAVTIDVLANDRDPNPKDEIRIVGVQAEGLQGIVTLNPDGTIGYDPNGQFTHLAEGETATETFTYTIADERGETDTATVTVEITGVNDAPIAADDDARTTQNHAVAIDVLANDVDPDASDVLEVVGVDVTGLLGNLAFLGDGQFVYDPAGRFDALAKGQTATETFQYAIADPHGEISIATVEILIEGVNDAPVANDDLVVVSEKGEVRFDALANDYDPDLGDTIKVVNLFSLGGSAGQRWINHDGTVTYRPYGAYDHLGQGEVAYQQFGYTIADQHGATDTAVITVQIVGVNDAPVAKDDKVHTDEKSPVEINVIANDYDPDKNDVFGVVAVDATGLQGELTYLGDGKFAYDPNGQFDHLAKGQTATETFQYMIADQHGAFDIATAKVVIHGVNDAPVAVTDFFTGFKDIGFYAPIEALLANDFDVDNGDTIHFAGLDNAVNGEVTVTPDGYVVFIPDAGYVGPASFQYAIHDQHGEYAIGDVFLDIKEIEPGDVSFEVLTWFQAISEAELTEHPDGSLTFEMLLDVGVVSAVGMDIGGMPFFTAVMNGELSGLMTFTMDAQGKPAATGDLTGDLDLEIALSPIFQPLGGDFYDDLVLATGGPSGIPNLPSAGFDPLADLALQLIDEMMSGGGPVMVFGEAIAEAQAFAFGDGTFYLDIKALLGGATIVDDGGNQPDFLAELLGELQGYAFIDIRDDLVVDGDGYIDGNFQVTTAPMPFNMTNGINTADLVTEDHAIAA